MTDIEQARTILTKWGEGVTAGPWTVDDVSGLPSPWVRVRDASGLRIEDLERHDAALIVAMTDPALREALDGMLAHVINYPGWTSGHMRAYVDRIAAVIIAIDQRMNA